MNHRAGVIGLGLIGGGIARWLAEAGLLSAVYDIRPDAANGLPGGPVIAASPAEVARHCDVAIIAVVDAAQTIAVLDGPYGLLSAVGADFAVILIPTIALDDLDRIRLMTDAAGVRLVDCGVAGGPAIGRHRLVSLVGGTAADLARVQPVLDGFSRSVLHMGAPGSGMAAKIALNAVVVGTLRAGFEGAALARAAGIDIRQLARAIDDTAEGRGPMMIIARPADPAVDAGEAAARESLRRIFVKDLDAALTLGRALGVALPLVELTAETSYDVAGLVDGSEAPGSSG